MTSHVTHLWRLLKWGRILARYGALMGIERDVNTPAPVRRLVRLARLGARVPKRPRYSEAFQAIGPAAIKLGQTLATRPDLVGEEATRDRLTLQDALPPVPFVKTVPFTTAADLFEAVKANAMDADALVMAAAVADYRPATVAADKVKKHDGEMSIALERTDDILAWVGAHKPEKLFVCGFSMETRDLIENSTAKLHKKNMDMIVANNLKVPGAGFGVDTNVVTIITAQGATELPLQSKDAVAGHIADAIAGK